MNPRSSSEALPIQPLRAAPSEEEQPDAERLRSLNHQAERLLRRATIADPDFVHDLRVCLRRIRVLCAELGRRSGSRSGAFRDLAAAARDLFRALGGIRDVDILRGELQRLVHSGRLRQVQIDDLLDWCELERRRLQAGLAEAATSFEDDLAEFWATKAAVQATSELKHPSPNRVPGVRKRARRLLRQLSKTEAHPSYEELHRLRIRAKQLRYAVEAPTNSDMAASVALVKRLKKLQDELGAIQDAAMAAARLDALLQAGTLTSGELPEARKALGEEMERRRRKFLKSPRSGKYANLWDEVKEMARRKGDGRSASKESTGLVAPGMIPGVGPATVRRLRKAGFASRAALQSASVEELAGVESIGRSRAQRIKGFLESASSDADGSIRPRGGAGDDSEPGDTDGKRFERAQAVRTLSAAVSDHARGLAEELTGLGQADARRAARQAQRLMKRMEHVRIRLPEIPAKRLKGLRGDLHETEGLLAKVVALEPSSLRMNKLRKALKAHRKAIESYFA